MHYASGERTPAKKKKNKTDDAFIVKCFNILNNNEDSKTLSNRFTQFLTNCFDQGSKNFF